MRLSKTVALSLIIILIIIASGSGAAVYADEGIYEGIDNVAQESGDENLIKYRDNYYLDTEKISVFKEPLVCFFDGIANLIFAFEKGMTELQILLFSFAFSTDIYEVLGEFLSPFLLGMKNNIFDTFATILISVCAFFFLIQLVMRRQTQVLVGAMQLILIIALAFVFYTQPVNLLKTVDNLTNEVADTVMEAPYQSIPGSTASDSAAGKSAAIIWNVNVHKPWQILEFGSVKIAQKYENEILPLAVGSDERAKKVEELAKEEGLFSKGASSTRVISALILLIFNMIITLVMIAFSILIIGFQFLTLLFFLLGIFVFLLALIPHFGFNLVKKWGVKILAMSGIKIILVFFLSLLMVFMDTMYGLADSHGLIFVLFMIIVMILMIVWRREDIIGLFVGFKLSTVTNPGQTINRVMDRDFNALQTLRSIQVNKNLKDDNYLNKDGYSTNFSKDRSRTPGSVSHPGSKTSATDNFTVLIDGSEIQNAADIIAKNTNDMSQYFAKAKELLDKQYLRSKTLSEEAGRMKGAAPEYTDFVKRTDAVRSLGAGEYDQRDISKTARILRNVESSGGNIDEFISSSEAHNDKVTRPKNLSSIDDDVKKRNPINMKLKEHKEKPEIKGLEFFRENFGDNAGEKFYAALGEKYDPSDVDNFSSIEKLSFAEVHQKLKTEKLTKKNMKPIKTEQITKQAIPINMRKQFEEEEDAE